MLLETDKKLLGKKFKEFRKSKSLTQFELAEKIGLNEKQISRIEAGQNYPTYMTFVKLIEVLDIDIKNFSHGYNDIEDFSKYELINLVKKSNNNETRVFLNTIKSLKKSLKNFKSS